MTDAPPRPPASSRRRAALAVLAALTLTPPAQVLLVRFVDPPLTWTMVERWWEDGERPTYVAVDLTTAGRHLPRAVVASEDAAFFLHHGFDCRQIREALRAAETGEGLRGASTITQQVARNVFLWQGRSWVRKGLEAVYTALLELLLPKERILELYLSVAEWGPGVFGAEAAATRWFGVPAARLNADQAARLAAILPSPRRWTPHGSYAGGHAARLAERGAVFPGDRGFDALPAAPSCWALLTGS